MPTPRKSGPKKDDPTAVESYCARATIEKFLPRSHHLDGDHRRGEASRRAPGEDHRVSSIHRHEPKVQLLT